MTDAELLETLVTDLEVELADTVGYDESKLRAKITQAITDVKRARRYYLTDYDDEQIQDDIVQFYANIRNISLYDYNQLGAEFQSYTGEGAIFRTYTDRNKLFSGVLPLAQCIQ